MDSNDTPLLDREASLQRLKGDQEFLETLYGVYIDDLPQKLDSIRKNFKAADMEQLLRSAHSLKGASATVGASALYQAALDLENAARNNNPALAEELIPKLEAVAAKTLEAMKGHLKD